MTKKVSLETVELNGEAFFKINNVDLMRPFFMSIVSNSNHWMFISSNGGLSAGRKNAQNSIFPYYTDDKITEASESTGNKTIIRISRNGSEYLWEPFSLRDIKNYNTTHNLYKNRYGNKLMFEVINHDLDLTFSYEWNTSDFFGFIKKSKLRYDGDNDIAVSIIDGLQNILPHGISSDLQNSASNLVDAYKRTELDVETGLGIFALSAVIVDKAEPSEALKANVAWAHGLPDVSYLLSNLQLDNFRDGSRLTQETDIKGEKGCYFLSSNFVLYANESKNWVTVIDVNKDHGKIAHLRRALRDKDTLLKEIDKDIQNCTEKLKFLSASSDAMQTSSDPYKDARHYSNVLFNIMRGGIFDHGYSIDKDDFESYLKNANKKIAETRTSELNQLPSTFALTTLNSWLENIEDVDLIRLAIEYLPLKFSRRHGDPSRPWNIFNINTKDDVDGSKILDYEGNWRDIFQNWEALAYSYPDFIEGMIFKFLNATTFDGYNPYRVTKGGIDWEVIEPDDPWSYIGYWGDHQIIYLLKFLEFFKGLDPIALKRLAVKDVFVYANVPYKIKPYDSIYNNPKDTIEFDHKSDQKIRALRKEIGADGALLRNEQGVIHRVNFIEKILTTVLAKISNFIPDAGIWMNTQRPEWNDANNALVGNGVSMVTLYYLRRFFVFLHDLLEEIEEDSIKISQELLEFYKQVRSILEESVKRESEIISPAKRKKTVDELGQAASDYRNLIYNKSFNGEKSSITRDGLIQFVKVTLHHLEKTIDTNKRPDNMYHAYNLMTGEADGIKVSYLSEMLEGQVAVLSSGYLSSKEAVALLDSMKRSSLFREDQYSYILYPNKELPGFLDRNTIPSNLVEDNELVQELIHIEDQSIIYKAIDGKYHFNGNFRNVNDLHDALDKLSKGKNDDIANKYRTELAAVFESVFNHKAFTGRSGTFYGYEGLGSIYWHMVSKLLLATQENCFKAIIEGAEAELVGRLLEHYYEIYEGIGVHKSPELYGAYPTDPYSHTPAGKGAQQPGMTGQVKEDILCRFGELGIFIEDGQLKIKPFLLRKEEFLTEEKPFEYYTLDGKKHSIDLPKDSLGFTLCQTPVIYHISDNDKILIHMRDGSTKTISGLTLENKYSRSLFGRSENITLLEISINSGHLK